VRWPSGTVTFLFSDIEGSTQRWESERIAMQGAVRRHDALIRKAIEARAGYVFKTIGDAFCAAFARAEEAVAAAVDAQRALSVEDFSAVDGVRVRMALHTGTTDERDGDYFGPAVNRVARLLAIGHGGQVLVSGVTADLLQGAMPPEIALRDLGEHRLKDLTQPDRVFQLVAPGLVESFPAPRSLRDLPNNLPRALTSFVGRDEVLADVKALVAKAPLVTLVGTGGAGKTRTALQVGADLLEGSRGGVWLVELAPVADPSLVTTVVAQVVGVRESANRSLLDSLLSYLKKKQVVIILDNCEHVVTEARSVAAAIVRNCPDVRILATSRESLNVGGERVYRIPSLAVPPASRTLNVTESLEYGAIVLFFDRAVASDSQFALSEDNVGWVAEICRRLDGIPLAIELAAARVKVLAPRQLAQKLDERFQLLTGGDRSGLPRQQTMRALIDWSYDLLSEQEQALFRRLSIFAGDFTLEVAGDVRRVGTGLDELASFEMLSSLVDKSLVQVDLTKSDAHYRVLESTRQYAREKLVECGEYDAIARAHAEAYLKLAEQLERTWATTPELEWVASLQLENWRAALEWAFGARGDALAGQRLSGVLRQAWLYLAVAEGRRWVRIARDTVDDRTPPSVAARLDLAEAQIDAAFAQRKASHAAAERALARYRQLDDQQGIAEAQRYIGRALSTQGRVAEGEEFLRAALAGFRRLDNRRLIALALRDLGVARSEAGDVAGARALLAEALPIFKETAADRQVATVTANLASAEFHGGDAQKALQLHGEALAAHRAFSDTRFIANDLSSMAAYLLALARWDEARRHAREALAVARDVQDEVITAFSLERLAAVAALQPWDDVDREQQGRERAAQLVGYVDARFAELEVLRESPHQHQYDTMVAALRDALGAASLEGLMADGRTWTEDRAVTEALQM
jgi:predicted ATPase/class 3 adenylate cyclase